MYLPPNDNDVVSIYMADVGAHSLLSKKEETKLFQQLDKAWPGRLKADKSKAIPLAAQPIISRLMAHNYKLVVSVVSKYTSSGIPLADLIQAGNEGLMRAIIKFETHRKGRLSTYAVWWIRQAASRETMKHKNVIHVPVHATEQYRKLVKIKDQITIETGNLDPPLEVIAIRMGEPWTVARIKTLLRLVNGSNTESLDEIMFDDSGSDRYDLVMVSDSADSAENIEQHDLKHVLANAMETLSSREQKIIEMRRGLNGFHPHTLREVGKKMELTRERIRQIEAEAMKKLRHPRRTRVLREFL